MGDFIGSLIGLPPNAGQQSVGQNLASVAKANPSQPMTASPMGFQPPPPVQPQQVQQQPQQAPPQNQFNPAQQDFLNQLSQAFGQRRGN